MWVLAPEQYRHSHSSKPIGLLHVAMTQGGALFDLIHPHNNTNSFTTLAQSWKAFMLGLANSQPGRGSHRFPSSVP